MAKRQNFVVGSTNAVTETMTTSELNHGFDRYEVLTADKLDGTLNSVSDYSNDSSNEIANAIQSITGAQPTGASQSELANALQQMRDEIMTSSLTFIGYVSTTAPSSSTYALVEDNLWINSATMPTSFPVAASSIKRWNGTSWVNYGSTYTPNDFDAFRNLADGQGYYWFGGQWTVMSTDMSTTYFTLNQSTGKWEIKSSVNLPGNPTTTTPTAGNSSTRIATTKFVADSFAPLASPALTGTPTAPTPAAGNSSTRIATTKFVADSFAPLASPALTGTPTTTTPTSGSPDAQIATKKYVDDAIAPLPKAAYLPDLFDWKWADHELDDARWLRADTFSWQSRSGYEVAYNHLAADITGKTLQSETIGSTTIQFYLADDGHKICPASQESNVTAIYNATGVAWYYIIDTVNQRFKLPRTKFGVTGLRDTVGKYVDETLPNLHIGFISTTADDVGFGLSGMMSSATEVHHVGFDGGTKIYGEYQYTGSASYENSIYKDGAHVQPKATQMYLYFYVGNFTQTALENTAGLNAELFNGKADTDLSNTPIATADYVVEWQAPTSQNNYTWYRKYKSGWVEQGGFVPANAGTTAVVVNLAISMANTDYSVIGQVYEAYTGTDSGGINFYDKTITTFKLNKNNSNRQAYWQVSGIAAN